MAKPEDDQVGPPGERRFTETGAVEVSDGERWVPDPEFPGDGESTMIRDPD